MSEGRRTAPAAWHDACHPSPASTVPSSHSPSLMANVDPERVPTIDDLKVKLCYICREEDRFDKPEDPPRAWTHPCKCTLVAHESCLLKWVRSAQQDPSRAPNALKCAQCGTPFELESDNPPLLRVLDALNGLLSTAGKAATIVGSGALAGCFLCTVGYVATSYGVFAVKEFLGEETFDLLLTDDPKNWPWHAYIDLPSIPFSLILARTRFLDTLALVPLVLTWATSPPVRPYSSLSPLSTLWGPLSSSPSSASDLTLPPVLNWPPTPLMCLFLFHPIRSIYRRLFARLTRWVMGTTGGADDAAARPIRRIIWALNEDGPPPLRVRIGANIVPAPRAEQPPNAAAANPDAAEPANDNADDDDPAAVAERTLHVTNASLGRFIGGALLLPTIASRMGALLLRLSRRSALLRAFLAVGPRPLRPLSAARIQLFARPPDSPAGLLRQVGLGLATGVHVLSGGTPAWNAQDPVWWRNAVGLGLFVFAKDCVGLLHLWLRKRELESRRVKSRSFAGIDIEDLLHPPPTDGERDA
ncbi:hypothetical protein BD413DRAFT_522534 [Trametes elegans]|nr:hypothetical protein BD413DRAFT_522534 [Trametes elegans]